MTTPSPARSLQRARRRARRAADGRWRSALGRWARARGLGQVASALTSIGVPVTRAAVAHWVAGRHHPRPEHALALSRLSGLPLERILTTGVSPHGTRPPQLAATD